MRRTTKRRYLIDRPRVTIALESAPQIDIFTYYRDPRGEGYWLIEDQIWFPSQPPLFKVSLAWTPSLPNKRQKVASLPPDLWVWLIDRPLPQARYYIN